MTQPTRGGEQRVRGKVQRKDRRVQAEGWRGWRGEDSRKQGCFGQQRGGRSVPGRFCSQDGADLCTPPASLS